MAVAREQDLNHDDAHGLEHDAADLEEEAGEAEVDLPHASDGHAGHDAEDGEHAAEIGVLDAPCPGDKQHGDGRGGLEHLDEGDAQVQIGQVAADETSAVEQSDRYDGAQVQAARHLHLVSAIEQAGGPRQDLRGDRREDEMPTC